MCATAWGKDITLGKRRRMVSSYFLRLSRSMGGGKWLKLLPSHCLVHTGWQSRNYSDWAHTFLHISLLSTPPPLRLPRSSLAFLVFPILVRLNRLHFHTPSFFFPLLFSCGSSCCWRHSGLSCQLFAAPEDIFIMYPALSLVCRPPAYCVEPQVFLFADHSNFSLPHML